MEFLLLLFSSWVVYKFIRSAFKAGANAGYNLPKESGWVYVIERDGFIKIGKSGFYKRDSSEKNKYLVSRLKNYVHISEMPKDNNVNLVYYHFYKDCNVGEKRLQQYLCNIAQKYSELKLSKKGFKAEEDGNVLELTIVPERKDEWFKYDCHFDKIYDRIMIWYRNSDPVNSKEYSWIIEKTNQELYDWNRIFLHKLPEIQS